MDKNIYRQLATSVAMLDPQYGETPEELSKLLLTRFRALGPSFIKAKLVEEMNLLAERVVDYNRRGIDPIFYLYAVAKYCPHRWKYELMMQEMEERLSTVLQPEERDKWMRCLYKLSDWMLLLLKNRLEAARESGGMSSVTPEKLGTILEMLSEELDFEEDDAMRLAQLALSDWLHELKSKIWEKQVDVLAGRRSIKREEKIEIVYLLLELENKKGEQFCRQLIKEFRGIPPVWAEFAELLNRHLYRDGSLANDGQERNFRDIVTSMTADGNTSTGVHSKLGDVKTQVSISKSNKFSFEKFDWAGPFESLQLGDIKKWAKHFKSTNDEERPTTILGEFLFVYDRAVQLKMKFRLRDAQRVTIATLLCGDDSSALAQVSTGEGKSLIVAGVAIYRALCGLKVDVITSNSVLAIRDSRMSVADGGLRDLYAVFDLDVANNCGASYADLVKSYDSAVVYGTLTNFERDYLCDTFYGRKIRGDRSQLEFVIVDEVDCMLLDNGNHMLYLSHAIPGMEMLESLYVFIWEKMRTTPEEMDDIKFAVLYDLYGAITKNDLHSVHGPLKDQPKEKDAIWAYLIRAGVINRKGWLLLEEVRDIEKTINYTANPELNPKLVYYFRNVAQRDRRIQIPSHLLPFVNQHLDTWLKNANYAALYYTANQHYVVDRDRASSSSELNPKVIIIDSDTGTDQTSSQWNESLHQFIQLKEGCAITLQNLKSVFDSNVSYIRRYRKLSGLTGTLGSKPEREFLQKTYNCEYFTVPTAFPKCFNIKPARVVKTRENWLKAIVEETRLTTARPTARSLVVFCESIKEVNEVRERLGKDLKSELDSKELTIHSYTRDYEKFAFESSELGVGHVIVATNLAGRGTDIKINEELRQNGGLHICLTYLPDNIRIEEQAFGRAGRKGDPGSGILIVETYGRSSNEDWGTGKIFELKEERNRRELQRISQLSAGFVNNLEKQEKCFQLFCQHYSKLKSQLTNLKFDENEIDTICYSALDRWAFWLDSIDSGPTPLESQSVDKLSIRLKNELFDKLQLPSSTSSHIDWLTPARSIVLAKYLATRGGSGDTNRAMGLLNRLADSKDSFFYPAAHYYRAYVIIKRGKFDCNKTEFIRTLRKTVAILNKHIDMQMTMSHIVGQTVTPRQEDAENYYNQQKENVVKILEYFVYSIHSFLGSQCSAEELKEAVDVSDSRANCLFDRMVRKGYVSCKVDSLRLAPNRDTAIDEVAESYSVRRESIEEYLSKIQGRSNLTENEMEKELVATGMIRRTRKEFWKLLLRNQVVTEAVDCAILDESECSRLDRNKRIPFTSDHVLYHPNYSDEKDMDEKKKIIFPKKYLKGRSDYSRIKKSFESNKIARLDFTKLKTVDLSTFSRLRLDDLAHANIATEQERQAVWKALVDQKIISTKGDLSSECADREFTYPNCPIYEDAVVCLLRRTFVAETVRRQWLQRNFRAINNFPLKPYRGMLGDLLAAQIVSGAVLTDGDVNLDQMAENLADDKKERQLISSYMRSRQAVYAALKSPQASLESIGPAMRQRKDMKNTSRDLEVFDLIGFDDVIKLEEKKEKWSWKMIFRVAVIIAFGIAQVAAGLLIQMKFAGMMSHVGSGLISEGISDVMFAVSALWSGNDFTWADYGRHKMISLAVTAVTFSVAAAFSRGVKFFKYGSKAVGPGLQEGGKVISQSASAMKLTTGTIVKEIAKQTAIKIGSNVALGLISKAVESLVHSKLAEFCKELGTKIIGTINRYIVGTFGRLEATLARLYHSHGLARAQRIVEKKMHTVVTVGLAVAKESSNEWLSRMFGAVTTGLGEALKKRKGAGAKEKALEIALSVMNYIKKIVEQFKFFDKLNELFVGRTNEFNNELEKACASSPVSRNTEANQNVNQNELEEFQEKVKNNLQNELGKEAGQMIESWTTEMLQGTAREFATLAAKKAQDIYRQHKEAGYMEELRKLQEKRRNEQRGQTSENRRPAPSDNHIKACQQLMRKTRNPKLFAAIIRNEDVPIDRIGVDALSSALPALLQNHGVNVSQIPIRIESSDGQFVHTSTTKDSENEMVVKIDRENDDQSGHYYNTTGDGDGSSSDGRRNCLFDCVAKQIKERYPHINLNSADLREQTADMIEKDASVSTAIRNGWHSYTIQAGLFGGRQTRNDETGEFNKGSYPVSEFYDQLNCQKKFVVERDHQPAASHLSKYARDAGVKNISRGKYPVLAIKYEDHRQTLNYKGRARASAKGIGEAWAFHSEQKGLLGRGEYKEALWHAVKSNWLSIAENENDVEDKKLYVTEISKHFYNFSQLKWADGSGKTFISKAEAKELTNRWLKETEPKMQSLGTAFWEEQKKKNE